jgi:hypothetical protein
MKLTLQFGYGMIAHSTSLVNDWAGGSVVLSPRDLTEAQLERTGARIVVEGGEVLVDPQCYLRQADHARLTNHAYFQRYQGNATGALVGGAATADFLSSVVDLNDACSATRFIVPGLLGERIDRDWAALQAALLEEAAAQQPERVRYATIAIGSDALRDDNQVIDCVDFAEDWDVDGFYVVPETPGMYLVEDPVWMANLLTLCAGLKLLGKRVLLGYSSHQMLAAACANVDEIASGTWLNVRAFSPEKFLTPDEGTVARRATWYYCPQAMSEYKLPFLDIALRQGVLPSMRPSAPMSDRYCAGLFAGAQPTATGWSEQYAFRHYLTSLHTQAAQLGGHGTFDATLAAYRAQLAQAGAEVNRLRSRGVLASQRSFEACLDANETALAILESNYGARFRTDWT